MKKYFIILTTALLMLSLPGCEKNRDKMSDDYPSDYTINYGIRQVLQYDPMNISGIDVAKKFPFFETFKLSIYYTNSKISAATLSNGTIPFSPFDFEIPEGKIDCLFDTDALPNELRIAGTDHVIAYYKNGEFSIPFQLDCPSLNYKYTFKHVE